MLGRSQNYLTDAWETRGKPAELQEYFKAVVTLQGRCMRTHGGNRILLHKLMKKLDWSKPVAVHPLASRLPTPRFRRELVVWGWPSPGHRSWGACRRFHPCAHPRRLLFAPTTLSRRPFPSLLHPLYVN